MACADVTNMLLKLSGLGNGAEYGIKYSHDATKLKDPLVRQLTELANAHQTIKTAILEVARSDSITVRAVATEIAIHTRNFLSRLAEIEDKIRHRDPEVIVEGQVSLIKLTILLKKSSLILNHLKNIVSELKAIDGSDRSITPTLLINHIQLDSLTGYRALKGPTEGLLRAVNRVYMVQIRQWCLYGELYSTFPGEFFIEMDTKGQFYLCESQCPKCIEIDAARQVFDLGQIIRSFTRGRNEAQLRIDNKTTFATCEQLFSELTPSFTSETLTRVVVQIRRLICRDIIAAVLSVSRIRHFLSFLKDFYLLDNGDFTLGLIQLSQEEFRSMRKRHLGALKDDTVHATLAKALTNFDATEEDSAEADIHHDQSHSLRESLRMILRPELERENSDSFAHFLFGVSTQMYFRSTWPLDNIVVQQDLEEYSDVFEYLVALRRAQERLHSLWRGRRNSQAHKAISTAAWSAAFRTQSFLGTLIDYYHTNVITDFSRTVEGAIEDYGKVYDLAMLSQRHRNALRVLKKAILMAEYQFLQIMKQLLTTVDQVVEAIQHGMEHLDQCKTMLGLIDDAISELVMEDGIDTLLLKLQIGSFA